MLAIITEKLLILAEIISLGLQLKYTKSKQSIYGLSIDYLILNILGRLLTQFSFLSYQTQNITKSQYAKRFPLFPTINLDPIQSAADFMIITLNFLTICQFMKYRFTSHQFQKISHGLILYIGLGFLISLWIFYNTFQNLPKQMGRYGLFYLDFIDFIWLFGVITDMVKLCPQLTLNWVGMTVRGVSQLSLKFELYRLILLIISKQYIRSQIDFHVIPINSKPIFPMIIQVICILIIYYQIHIYKDIAPYLSKRYELKDEERND